MFSRCRVFQEQGSYREIVFAMWYLVHIYKGVCFHKRHMLGTLVQKRTVPGRGAAARMTNPAYILYTWQAERVTKIIIVVYGCVQYLWGTSALPLRLFFELHNAVCNLLKPLIHHKMYRDR